jgi:hypothetical protein
MGGSSSIGRVGRVGGSAGLGYQGWSYMFCTITCTRNPCAMER